MRNTRTGPAPRIAPAFRSVSSKDASVALTVTRLGHDAAGAMRLRFEVRDTGQGIAQDYLDSVFDAFTQADASTTRRHGGSGLGLAIAKDIAKSHGGDIALGESSMGGLRAIISVPL